MLTQYESLKDFNCFFFLFVCCINELKQTKKTIFFFKKNGTELPNCVINIISNDDNHCYGANLWNRICVFPFYILYVIMMTMMIIMQQIIVNNFKGFEK